MDLLNDVEVRVLGALLEKERTTPEYYPLSLNALTNACNQKSNRDPVMSLDPSAVEEALDSLREKKLVRPADSLASRVLKYEHRLSDHFNFDRREVAVLCVLMLRGPQTLGELHGRTERMYSFDDLATIESTLNRLIQWDPPLVKRLPRQSGTKEPRYAHLLACNVESFETSEPAESESSVGQGKDSERLTRLEAQVDRLEKEVADLRKELLDFRKQFE